MMGRRNGILPPYVQKGYASGTNARRLHCNLLPKPKRKPTIINEDNLPILKVTR